MKGRHLLLIHLSDGQTCYMITASDEGKSIKAVISYEDNQGFDETVTTDSSVKVSHTR